MQCPNCGSQLDITDLIPLTARQQETYDAVLEIQRNDARGTASTQAVAAHLCYSERWIREWLQHLEQLGLVHRPRGKKSGWRAIRNDHVIIQLRFPVQATKQTA